MSVATLVDEALAHDHRLSGGDPNQDGKSDKRDRRWDEGGTVGAEAIEESTNLPRTAFPQEKRRQWDRSGNPKQRVEGRKKGHSEHQLRVDPCR